jgi:hypothetical protein
VDGDRLYLAFEALRAYGVLDDKVRRHMHKITRVQTLILHDGLVRTV